MTYPVASYADLRSQLRAGDVLAFGGKGGLSEGIKLFTRGPVSHVGAVLRRALDRPWSDTPADRYFVEVIESTSLGGRSGVMTSRFSDRLRDYGGEVWWLPLSEEVRSRMRLDDYFDFMFDAEGREYDLKQAIGAGVDFLDWAGAENEEDFTRFFCSELVAAALERGGVVPSINASEVTPIELCRWDIFEGCYQLAGKPMAIRGFNTLPPR